MKRLVGAIVVMFALSPLLAETSAAHHSGCVTTYVSDEVCNPLLDLDIKDPNDPNSSLTPDLCDDDGDSYEQVYAFNPERGAVAVVGISNVGDVIETIEKILEPGREAPASGAFLTTGSLTYSATVWKCSDFNFVNQVVYYGTKHGYIGGGDGWFYADDWVQSEVECYAAAEIDVGQITCEAWARQAPTYTTGITEARFTFLDFPTAGKADWGGSPETTALVWRGDYAGENCDVAGACVTISASMLVSSLLG